MLFLRIPVCKYFLIMKSKFSSSVFIPSVKLWGIYVVSVVLVQLLEPSVLSGETSFIERMICWTNPSIFVLYVFTAFVILESLLYLILKFVARRNDAAHRY